MSKENDGGPAFPGRSMGFVGMGPFGEAQAQYSEVPGMSLRDYFAANASADDVMRHRFENPDGSERKPYLTVEQAKWEYADAMLAEREK